MTTRIALIAGTALAALAFVGSSVAMTHPKLTGDVGPGFTIHLKKAGKTVTTLTKGTYTVTVTDKSAIHNFHLTGPGVNKEITGVGFQGTKTVTLTFKKGTYKFVCDPHASLMKGSFKVT